jgi:hypothetical protein
MTKLPEPDTHCFDDDAGLDVWSYSKAQMLQFRRDALEEAAKVCDEHLQYPSLTPKHCADHLRALKDET